MTDKVGAVSFDITDEAAVAAGVAHAEATYGPLDILVNNAGIQHRVPCWNSTSPTGTGCSPPT